MKVVIQNINNPRDKKIIEDAIHVDCQQNFMPIDKIKARGAWYIFYERSFDVVKCRDANDYLIVPKHD